MAAASRTSKRMSQVLQPGRLEPLNPPPAGYQPSYSALMVVKESPGMDARHQRTRQGRCRPA